MPSPQATLKQTQTRLVNENKRPTSLRHYQSQKSGCITESHAERRVRGPSGMFFSVSYRTYYQHSCHLVCGITDLTLGVMARRDRAPAEQAEECVMLSNEHEHKHEQLCFVCYRVADMPTPQVLSRQWPCVIATRRFGYRRNRLSHCPKFVCTAQVPTSR